MTAYLKNEIPYAAYPYMNTELKERRHSASENAQKLDSNIQRVYNEISPHNFFQAYSPTNYRNNEFLGH